jgi:toxin ParE1/3/4
MPIVITRPRARDDLIEIWEYIAEDNVARADAFIDSINVMLNKLAEYPLLGRARPELTPKLRSFPIGRYVLFYEPTADGIELLRVLHSSRDISASTDGQ